MRISKIKYEDVVDVAVGAVVVVLVIAVVASAVAIELGYPLACVGMLASGTALGWLLGTFDLKR